MSRFSAAVLGLAILVAAGFLGVSQLRSEDTDCRVFAPPGCSNGMCPDPKTCMTMDEICECG